jgi:hypothetical protein
MNKLGNARCAALAVGMLLVTTVWIARGPVWAQEAPSPDTKTATQREIVQRVMQSFAEAVVKNDVDAALALFPTQEDLTTLLGPENAARSASELRSHLKMNFHEFVDALKAFGKADLVLVEPGKIRRVPKGESGTITDSFIAEGGYMSFARDGNYFIELRFNLNALLRVTQGRWVISSMQTRADRFPHIQADAP